MVLTWIPSARSCPGAPARSAPSARSRMPCSRLARTRRSSGSWTPWLETETRQNVSDHAPKPWAQALPGDPGRLVGRQSRRDGLSCGPAYPPAVRGYGYACAWWMSVSKPTAQAEFPLLLTKRQFEAQAEWPSSSAKRERGTPANFRPSVSSWRSFLNDARTRLRPLSAS